MTSPKPAAFIAAIADGRTELVFELIDAGGPPSACDPHGVSLLQHCAYYGDVSAIKFLLERGEALKNLGEDFGLIAAAFHGHWRLCNFLLENGADANTSPGATGETPLHAALCTTDRVAHDRVLKVLLAYGADPNRPTVPGAETGSFMRDVRTRGETPLHRAAAFGTVDTIKLLLDAGAKRNMRDVNDDSPLSWASWHLRPAPVLHLLCFGDFRVRPERKGMRENLQGTPHVGLRTP
jgi:uncharacterized protein